MRRSEVPAAGLEPASPHGQGILSPLCLPFHHTGVAQPLIRSCAAVNSQSFLHFHLEQRRPATMDAVTPAGLAQW